VAQTDQAPRSRSVVPQPYGHRERAIKRPKAHDQSGQGADRHDGPGDPTVGIKTGRAVRTITPKRCTCLHAWSINTSGVHGESIVRMPTLPDSMTSAIPRRVPSPGACVEDRRRAVDHQIIAAKHPFRRGAVLRVRPFGLNPERMAARIARRRKKRGSRPSKPHSSNTRQDDRGPRHHCPQAVSSGPEGRQTIAQRVSVGFRPPMNHKPRQRRQNPFPRERQHPLPSPAPDNNPEHGSKKPQSLEAAKGTVITMMESRCFHRFEITPASFHQRRPRRTTDPRLRPSSSLRVPPPLRNSFSRRDAETAEVGKPFITAFLGARRGAAQTRDQGSGVGKATDLVALLPTWTESPRPLRSRCKDAKPSEARRKTPSPPLGVFASLREDNL